MLLSRIELLVSCVDLMRKSFPILLMVRDKGGALGHHYSDAHKCENYRNHFDSDGQVKNEGKNAEAEEEE